MSRLFGNCGAGACGEGFERIEGGWVKSRGLVVCIFIVELRMIAMLSLLYGKRGNGVLRN